jgi:replicative DNA helicase
MAQDPIKVAPHSLDAERSVLGAILLDPVTVHQAMEVLLPEDFYRPSHAMIFRSFMSLTDGGKQCDLLLLQEELERQGKLSEAGGSSYLSSLVDTLPSSSNLPHYAQIVKEKSILRRLLRVSQEVTERIVSSGETTEAILDWAERQIFSVTSMTMGSDLHEMKDVVNEAMKEIENLFHRKTPITGLPTGFHELDQKTSGLQKGDLVVIAARPSMGKTALALNIAQHVACDEKQPVVIFSIEMSHEQLGMRMLASEARVRHDWIKSGMIRKRDFSGLITAADRLAGASIAIDDSPSLTVLEIRAKARRLKSEGRLALMIIDYLGLIRSVGKVENRQQEISDITRSLKSLAKELSVPIILVSQLSRAVESRKPPRPMLSDLRESGAIEQDADLVLFIYRESFYEPEKEEARGVAEIIIGKQRNGPTGAIKVAFQGEFTRFSDLATAGVESSYGEDVPDNGEGE